MTSSTNKVVYWGTGRRKTSIARVRLTPGKGEIIINTLNITSTTRGSGLIEIQAFPESNDVIGLKDLYLQLDMSNTKINMVRDTISSGQQISGIGYRTTSSYSNGTIIRS